MHVLSTLAVAIQVLALTAEAKRKVCPAKSASALHHHSSTSAATSTLSGVSASSIAVTGTSLASAGTSSAAAGTSSAAAGSSSAAAGTSSGGGGSSSAAAGTTATSKPASATSASSSAAATTSASSSVKPPSGLAFAPAVLTGAISGLRYSNVGGSGGTYTQITNMNKGTWPTCDVQACETKPVSVSGKLAPFDDQMTFVFRSMNVHNIAVYQPQGGDAEASAWDLVSSFTSGSPMTNMVWMNNDGGGDSGEWDICNGASQSFADTSFTKAASSPTAGIFNGQIPPGKEANIMTSAQCTADTCPGFSRGEAMVGWGGSKLMITTFDMPATDADKPPAIWALNTQVVRSAQYGCNCRGMGGSGGCGELDIFEVLTSAPANQGYSEVYSFKGATGSGGNFFSRPTTGPVTYATLFDVQTDSISIIRLDSFDYSTQNMPRSTIDDFATTTAKTISFGGSKKRHARGAYQSHDLRRRHGSF